MRGPDITDPHRTTTDPHAPPGSVHHVTHTHTGAPTHDRVADGVDSKTLEQVRKDAYKAGVADERGRHKRNPLLSILIALAAVLGLAVVVLYFVNGRSFSGAGATLDQATSEAAQQARSAGREVADETGEGLQDAGRNIEQRGEAGRAPAAGPAQPERPLAPAPAAPAADPAASGDTAPAQ
jgi:hypothetical protein